MAPELEVETHFGDADDPISALLSVTDAHRNRGDLVIGLRGLDPGAFSRAQEVNLNGQPLRVIGREDFIATKAFAGSALDLSDARQAIAVDRNSLDLELLRRLSAGRADRSARHAFDVSAATFPARHARWSKPSTASP